MADLVAAVEDWIARLPAAEFRALVARTRPPNEPASNKEENQ